MFEGLKGLVSLPGVNFVSHMLATAGITDPKVFEMAEKLQKKPTSLPKIISLPGHAVNVPNDADVVAVRSETEAETVYILVYTRQKQEKTLDGPLTT